MSLENTIKNARLFDRRTAERNIKRGIITRKEYTDHLNSLADAANKAVQRSADHVGSQASTENISDED